MNKTDLKEIEVNYPEIYKYIQDIEKQNLELTACIEDTYITCAGYDGYGNSLEGMKKLIDEVMKLLSAKTFMGLCDSDGRESCPICFRPYPDAVPVLKNMEENLENDPDYLLQKYLKFMKFDEKNNFIKYIAKVENGEVFSNNSISDAVDEKNREIESLPFMEKAYFQGTFLEILNSGKYNIPSKNGQYYLVVQINLNKNFVYDIINYIFIPINRYCPKCKKDIDITDTQGIGFFNTYGYCLNCEINKGIEKLKDSL